MKQYAMEKAQGLSDKAFEELQLCEISNETQVFAVIIVRARVTKVLRRSTNPMRALRDY